MKLGMPARTLEGSGSYSSGRQTSTMDATFSWDAERDVSKQVGFSAKLTEGEKTKADLVFRLPAIGKVRLTHCFNSLVFTQVFIYFCPQNGVKKFVGRILK